MFANKDSREGKRKHNFKNSDKINPRDNIKNTASPSELKFVNLHYLEKGRKIRISNSLKQMPRYLE